MFVRARTTFLMPGRRRVVEGAIYRDDDPIVVSRPALFEPVEAAAAGTADSVESATAAPGEKRTTTRRRAKAED